MCRISLLANPSKATCPFPEVRYSSPMKKRQNRQKTFISLHLPVILEGPVLAGYDDKRNVE